MKFLKDYVVDLVARGSTSALQFVTFYYGAHQFRAKIQIEITQID